MTAPPADQAHLADPASGQDAGIVPPQPSQPRPSGPVSRPVPATTSARPGGRRAGLSDRDVLAAIAAAAWAVYFASLVAVYLVSFSRHVTTCQSAAEWGMGVSLAAALLAVPFVTSRRARPSRPALAPAGVLTALIVLAAASVAVIWVAVNLTLANDTAGAWTLTIVALAAPAAALLARLPSSAAPGPLAVPVAPVPGGTPGAELPGSLPADKETPDNGAVTDSEAARVRVLDRETDTVVPGSLDTRIAVPAAPAPLYAPEPAPVVPRERPRLLSRDWADRLGSNAPKVALDAGFWELVLATLGKRHNEIGGVALTVRTPGTLLVLGMVLPEQIYASHSYCEFSSEEVIRVRDVIDQVAEALSIDTRDVKITWVHTHPGLGVFLSGTDQETTRQWRAFDPGFTPIVLDPLASSLSGQIGVFDAHNKRIEHVRIVPGLVNLEVGSLLKHELTDAYQVVGTAGAKVLLPGADG